VIMRSAFRPAMAALAAVALGSATLSACAGAGTSAQGAAESCEDYPSKPIDLVVPYEAGGGTDQIARVVSDVARKHDLQLRPQLKPGAGGAIGTQAVVDAAADGYTITVGTDGSIVGNPLLKSDVDYEIEDLAPVATISETSFTLLVAPDSGIKTWDDLIEASKKEKLSYGTPSAGGTLTTFMNMMAEQAGVTWSEVPFDGSSEAVVAAAGGNVDFAVASSGSSVSQVESGLVHAVASTGEERVPSLPDVPTLSEEGVELVVPAWRVIAAPAGVEQCKLDYLEKAFADVGADADFKEKASAIEGEPLTVQGQDYTSDMIEAYTAEVEKAIK